MMGTEIHAHIDEQEMSHKGTQKLYTYNVLGGAPAPPQTPHVRGGAEPGALPKIGHPLSQRKKIRLDYNGMGLGILQ